MNEHNLPPDWTIRRLKDICTINSDSISDARPPTHDFFYQDLSTVNNGRLIKQNSPTSYTDAPSRARRLASKGDVAMSTVRPYLKGFAQINFDANEYVFSTGFAILRPLSSGDQGFIFQNLFSGYFDYQYNSFLVGSNYPALNSSDVEALKVPYPNRAAERQKIAEILGACDEAIEAQERLIAQKQQRKKGLMQKLLTGEVRFPEFAGTPWREVTIGSLLKEVKRPVDWDDNEQYRLLSLRRRSGGPFARESLYGREIKTKTLKTVRTGDFLIAKMQVTHGALGMVTPEFDQYKVSASYICLVPRDSESFDIRFFNYLSQLRYIWHLAYVASYGVTIEKMTFVPKDFLKKKINVPSNKKECVAIADFIDSVNEEIALQQTKLEQLKQQKKGLMQQLLTGKVRVKV